MKKCNCEDLLQEMEAEYQGRKVTLNNSIGLAMARKSSMSMSRTRRVMLLN